MVDVVDRLEGSEYHLMVQIGILLIAILPAGAGVQLHFGFACVRLRSTMVAVVCLREDAKPTEVRGDVDT